MAKRKNQRRKNRKPPKRRAASPATTAVAGRRPIRLRPLSWEGEPAEDQAVFDDQALAGLAPERSAEVLAVRESLQLVANSADDAALERLSSIPRRSPLSDWRILARGLTEWYADRFEAAAEVWRRLDPQRRPGRIAQALLAARREDLSQLSPTTELTSSQNEPAFDSGILAAARRVRKTWIDRPALSEASRCIGFAEPRQVPNTPPVRLSPPQLEGLLEFSRKYRDVEPDLVADLQAAGLERAFLQPYADLFTRAQKTLSGPVHDPANLLLRFHYFTQFGDDEDEDNCEIALKQYLSTSLPNNQQLSAELAAALRSRICLMQARRLLAEHSASAMFRYFRPPPADKTKVESLFAESIRAYPAHGQAHQAYVGWIREVLNDWLDKATQERFESKLRAAMEQWSQNLPEEIEPHLWLVDEYLNEESLELAEPHVQWLSQSRHPDPRVRIIPWKWQMLEAMRLCRRKTWLPQAAEKLDAAEAQWPSWLRKTWLPYLRAALALRSGQHDAFEQQRDEIHKANAQQQPPVWPLADAVMMLAAAQRLRVPAADLKPLRAPVDAAVANLAQLSIPELASAGSFYWDMHRIQMLYPAYQRHGKKFAEALKRQLQNTKKMNTDELQPSLWEALFWISERRLWPCNRDLPLPGCLDRFKDDARYAAATIHHLLHVRSNFEFYDFPTAPEILRTAASTEQDVYYRYWYGSLAEKVELHIAEEKRERERYRPNPFFSFQFDDDDDDEDDDDDVWDEEDENFDRNCECEHCTAMRERLGIPHPTASPPSDDEDDDPSGEDDSGFAGFVPPTPRRKATEIPLDPEFRRKRPKNPMAKKRKKNKK